MKSNMIIENDLKIESSNLYILPTQYVEKR